MLLQLPNSRNGGAIRRKANRVQALSPFEEGLRHDLEHGLTLAYESAIGGWRKRAFDLALVCFTAPVWAPALGVLAAMAHLRGIKPVFAEEHCVGHGGDGFRRLTLRYRPHKPPVLAVHSDETEIAANDAEPTVLAWGELLERLPQVINVFRGEMSLVGPRPMAGDDIEALTKSGKKFYLSTRPGIFSLSDVEDDAPLSLQVKHYAMTWSLSSDMSLALEVVSRASR